jgi:hypothetical protein
LCGVSVFVVALPLAYSSPFPTPKQRDWIIPTSPIALARPMPAPQPAAEPAATSAVAEVEPDSFAARWNPTSAQAEDMPVKAVPTRSIRLAALTVPTEVVGSIGPVEAARPKPIAAPAALPPPPKKRDVMEDVDQYLWDVYRRQAVKSDSTGDFTWKDPAAAKRLKMSLQAYVIGGMDPDFREQLYHAGRAMDGVGIRWSMLSAFRDDYRQSLAAGFKASARNSLHGGSAATGGYGHGRAIDITSAGGDAEAVWRWIDAHGARFGLRRPMPGADPAHIQAGGNWHQVAASLRTVRVRLADGPHRTSPETVAVKTKAGARAAM